MQTRFDPFFDWDARVSAVALEPAVTVTRETPLTALLPLLHSALQMRAVVIDADGAPIGMISESDLLTRVAPEQRSEEKWINANFFLARRPL